MPRFLAPIRSSKGVQTRTTPGAPQTGCAPCPMATSMPSWQAVAPMVTKALAQAQSLGQTQWVRIHLAPLSGCWTAPLQLTCAPFPRFFWQTLPAKGPSSQWYWAAGSVLQTRLPPHTALSALALQMQAWHAALHTHTLQALPPLPMQQAQLILLAPFPQHANGSAHTHAFIPQWEYWATAQGLYRAVHLRISPKVTLSALKARWKALCQQQPQALPLLAAPTGPLPLQLSASTPQACYLQQVQAILQAIAVGRYQKAVLSCHHHYSSPLGSAALQQALAHWQHTLCHGHLFHYAFGPRTGILGASPEVLFALQGLQGYTEVVAGTHLGANTQTPCELSVFDSKTQHEHHLGLEFASSTLSQLGWHHTPCSPTQVRPLGALQHLFTPVTVQWPQDSLDLQTLLATLAALHPTPATSGAPRQAALQHLHSLEGHTRRFYGGYVGRIGACPAPASAHLDVILRSIQYEPQGFHVMAGCGIVQGSQPQAEYLEAQAKLQAILQPLSQPARQVHGQSCPLSTQSALPS